MKKVPSKILKIIGTSTLGLFLILGNTVPALASTGDLTSEIRTLLQTQYANPLPPEALNEPTYQKMLADLKDPYTLYLSPKAYQDFLNMMEMKFTGIGIYANIVPQGVEVTGVIPGSPAEAAGLTKGDIIMDADGHHLAGLMQEDALNYLRGPAGSQTELIVLEGTDPKIVKVTRAIITQPDVSGQVIDGHIGYIAISTFGRGTVDAFKSEVETLKNSQNAKVDSWIIDMRNNPGGYFDSAVDLAGYFIGPSSTVQVKDHAGNITLYPAVPHSFVLNQPMVFLTNENTASAAEILSAAVQDHQKALLVGTKTYGKGSVQGVFLLPDGGALKMTVGHFFSPLGHTIDKVGVSPDVAVDEDQAEKVGELLLSDTPEILLNNTANPNSGNSTVNSGSIANSDSGSVSSGSSGSGSSGSTKAGNSSNAENAASAGYVKLALNGQVFDVSLQALRSPEYWADWQAVLQSLAASSDIQTLSNHSWQPANQEDLSQRWPLFYPGYANLGTLKDIPLDKKFTVHFSSPINMSTVNAQNVELINANSGQRVPVSFHPLSTTDLQVIPQGPLQAGTEYWLAVHPEIQDLSGHPLGGGGLAVARTLPK